MTQSHPQLTTQHDLASPGFDCLVNTIIGFLTPFFLIGAAGNPAAARAAIMHLIEAYNPRTTADLDLVGRIIGFSTVAMDNLRLSMTEGLSDTKVLQYRSNAVSLSRAAEQARQMLRTLQQNQETTRGIPRPTVSAAPAPPPASPTTPPKPNPTNHVTTPTPDIETMKRDARIMMAAFSKHGASSNTAIHMNPDPASTVRSAARAAITAAQRPPAA